MAKPQVLFALLSGISGMLVLCYKGSSFSPALSLTAAVLLAAGTVVAIRFMRNWVGDL